MGDRLDPRNCNGECHVVLALRARLAEVERVAAERLTMMRGKDAELTALRQTTATARGRREGSVGEILTVEQIQMIADEFGCETSFFDAENAAHVGWDPKMGDVYDSHEALRARLAEVERERDVETALKRDLEEARDDWCADCKSVDFANADASKAFLNERAAIVRAEEAEKRAEDAERALNIVDNTGDLLLATTEGALDGAATLLTRLKKAESDARALRAVLSEVLACSPYELQREGKAPRDLRHLLPNDLRARATALAAGKDGK